MASDRGRRPERTKPSGRAEGWFRPRSGRTCGGAWWGVGQGASPRPIPDPIRRQNQLRRWQELRCLSLKFPLRRSFTGFTATAVTRSISHRESRRYIGSTIRMARSGRCTWASCWKRDSWKPCFATLVCVWLHGPKSICVDGRFLTGLRTLRLVDFTGPGLSVVGMDGGVNTGPYRISQAWARALFNHTDAPDGVLYPSRHDPSLKCAAVFSRSGLALLRHFLERM